jgi:hypothetical protein
LVAVDDRFEVDLVPAGVVAVLPMSRSSATIDVGVEAGAGGLASSSPSASCATLVELAERLGVLGGGARWPFEEVPEFDDVAAAADELEFVLVVRGARRR